MWHTKNNPGKDTWVKFDFGELKSIDQMYVWNINQRSDIDNTDRGFKNVKIEYSQDGKTWTELAVPEGIEYKEAMDVEYPFQFARASGENGITATNLNTEKHEPISFDNATARYVRIRAKDSWGASYWGLSELMFTEGESKPIASIKECSAETVVNRNPVLPKTVTAVLEDGIEKEVEVVWEEINPDFYAQTGTFTVSGKAAGTDISAECRVTVKLPVQDKDVVTDVIVKENEDGTYVLEWKDPKAEFEQVTIQYQNGNASNIVEVKKGVQTYLLNNLQAGRDYRFDLWVEDAHGYTSDKTSIYCYIDGIIEVDVKEVQVSSQWDNKVTGYNTINKSGIIGTNVTNYRHDNNKDAQTMWHTSNNAGTYISYDFGSTVNLDQLYIWNMNQVNNNDRGLKNVKIEYSNDGKTWTALKAPEGIVYKEAMDPQYPFQFAKASGENGILATNLNTEEHQPVDFHGVSARYVKLSAKDSWGSPYWGLSEVVFTQKSKGDIALAEDVTVQTVTGQIPQLPGFVKVLYTSGNEEPKAVIWDDFDEALCEQTGEFSVKGKLFGTDKEVTCKVIVKESSVVDKRNLLTFIDVATGKEKAAYSEASWTALMTVLEKANEIYDSSDASQKEVDAVCKELEKAVEELELIISQEILDAMLHQAEELLENADVYEGEEGYEGQFSQADYDVFCEKAEACQAKYEEVMGDIDPDNVTEYDKGQMAEIAKALEQAIDEFHADKVHIDFTELDELLQTAEELDESRYTDASWKKLELVMTEIEELTSDRSKVKQSLIDGLSSRLHTAIEELEENADGTIDKADLAALIKYAKEQKDKAEYKFLVPAVKNAFEAALNAAVTVKETAKTQTEVVAAYDKLLKMVHMLDFTGNSTKLDEMIQQVKNLKEEHYTATTWAVFDAARTEAKRVLSEKNSLQAEIDEARIALRNAIFGLRLIPDKGQLEGLIKGAEAINTANYTVKSATAFVAALDNAKVVFTDAEATEEEVEAAEKALAEAQKNLVAKADADKVADREAGGKADGNADKADHKVASDNGSKKEASKTAAKTGDSAPMGVFMFACIAAGLVLIAKKKKFYK